MPAFSALAAVKMGTDKTKAQLLAELEELRAYVASLEQTGEAINRTPLDLSRLSDVLPVILFTTNAVGDFAVTYMDPMVKSMTGYQSANFMSDPSFWTERIHPDDRERVLSSMPQILETGRHERVYRWRVANGSYRWFWDTLRLVELPGGTRQVAGTTLDITRQKRIEEELRASRGRLQNILDSASSGIISVDHEQRIILFNRQAERLFGYEAEEVMGQPLSILMPEQYRAGHEKHVHDFGDQDTAWRTMSERLMPIFGLRKDGQEFPAEIAISRYVEGERLIFTAVVNDITQRKQAEETLAARNTELEAYNHTVAHDLKAPLGLIAGYANLLLEELEADDPRVGKTLQTIQSTAMKMGDMVDQLLWLSRVRDRNAVVEWLEMGPIVRAAVDRFKDRIDARGVAIKVAPDLPPAMGHALWVEEVFANLVGNAVKYIGPDNPSPRIEIRAEDEGPFVRYEVRDNGEGIAADAQQHLFGEFFRSHQHRADGLGLGLSIVHRIVTRLEGKVGVESEEGQGSTFWFTLPAPHEQSS